MTSTDIKTRRPRRPHTTVTAAPGIAARRLHLIDIENEVEGHVTPNTCREFLAAYTRLGILGPRDHIVIGVSPSTLTHTFVLPAGWRRVMGPQGPQSADLALLSAEPATEHLTTYSELVLASADGGFLDLALRAKHAGLGLTVVTNQRRAPHWRLYTAAHRHLTITINPTSHTTAA